VLLSIFDLVAILLTVSAAFAFINAKLLRLPTTIGVMIMGLAASLTLIGLELLTAETQLSRALTDAVRQIDFTEALMHGMLAFLLFAGALHVDLIKLKSRTASVGLLATVGVLVSITIVGISFWLVAGWLGSPIALIWALVFGALISPTDPVAVLSILKAVHVPEELEVEMTGEALLNDGVGVVVFTILVAAAVGTEGVGFGVVQVGQLFFVEALGGAILGLITGYVAYRAMRLIDDYRIEVLISLAVVMGTYALASKLDLSGPIAMVCAGLLIGERGPADAMSETTQQYLFSFWTLIDEIQHRAFPADRARSAGVAPRSGRDTACSPGHPHRSRGAVRFGGCSRGRVERSNAIHERNNPRTDLGRRAWRDFNRAGVVHTGISSEADYPRCDLCGGHLFDRRPGPDSCTAGAQGRDYKKVKEPRSGASDLGRFLSYGSLRCRAARSAPAAPCGSLTAPRTG
jgi:CPA1 family monovalent cation:H+ antiporter